MSPGASFDGHSWHWPLVACLGDVGGAVQAQNPAANKPQPSLRRDNLVAWCIVPFDAKKRGPEERAAMLERLGFKHFAYDWRAEHIPTFDAEIEALEEARRSS